MERCGRFYNSRFFGYRVTGLTTQQAVVQYLHTEELNTYDDNREFGTPEWTTLTATQLKDVQAIESTHWEAHNEGIQVTDKVWTCRMCKHPPLTKKELIAHVQEQ